MGKGSQLTDSDYLSERTLFVYLLRQSKVNYTDIAKMIFVDCERSKDIFATAKRKIKKAVKLGVSESAFVQESCDRRNVQGLACIHQNRLARALDLERRKKELEEKFNKLERERVAQIAAIDNALTALGITGAGGVVYLTQSQAKILNEIACREFENLVGRSQREVDEWRTQLIRLHSEIQSLRIDPTEKIPANQGKDPCQKSRL